MYKNPFLYLSRCIGSCELIYMVACFAVIPFHYGTSVSTNMIKRLWSAIPYVKLGHFWISFLHTASIENAVLDSTNFRSSSLLLIYSPLSCMLQLIFTKLLHLEDLSMVNSARCHISLCNGWLGKNNFLSVKMNIFPHFPSIVQLCAWNRGSIWRKI